MTVKKAMHPDGVTEVIFDSDWHSYTINGRRLVSGTKYIKRFFPEFDKEKIGTKYAEKHDMTLDEVLALWAEKGRAAAQFGTDIHEYAEMQLLGEMPPVFRTDRHQKYCAVVDSAIDQIKERFEILEVEKVIFSPKDMLAGMIDILVKDKENGDIVLLDWKTNEKITEHNPWQCALPPYQNILTDCNFDHYRCQLNLYRRLLDNEGYFEDGTNYRMALIHLTEDKAIFKAVEYLDI
jgi:ATP-dependent exoDNAse (exonuclease V) beta subunit